MKILAIETSCDDTSASVIIDTSIRSNVISSQYFHAKYGGIIPELASRAHLNAISEITSQALTQADTKLEDIELIAVTTEPGLAGSLVVGSSFAKGLSLMNSIPVMPVNHIEGHLFSACMENPDLSFPFVSLVVSGGHTAIFFVESYSSYSIIGLTKDDAAGEAFDKTAKLLGLEYPGGPLIDKLAKTGNPDRFKFPRPMLNENNFHFSFSGLKTSVRYFIQKNYPDNNFQSDINDIAASIQEAIVDVLISKTIKAAKQYSTDKIAISGGVSANSRLREKLMLNAQKKNIMVYMPKMGFCIDNAAMIGFLAEKKIHEKSSLTDYTFTVNSKPIRNREK